MTLSMRLALLLALPTAVAMPASAQAPTVDFENWPASPGSWSYRAQGGESQAWFMDTSGIIRLFVQCTMANRTVTISRTSSAPASSLSVWTTSAQRALPARFDANSQRVLAGVNSADPLLDAIAFSRGRIAISMPGSSPLVVPSAPEAARVFEDCRN